MSTLPIQMPRPIGLAIGALLLTAPLAAQQHSPSGGAGGHAAAEHGVHMSHPIVAEPVSPETGVRLEYQLRGQVDGGSAAASMELALAYALTPHVGLELGLPFQRPEGEERALGAPHLGLHLASFALAEHGLLLGGGVEVTLPEAEHEEAGGHGHSPVRLFVSAGYKAGELELIGSSHLGLGGAARDGRPGVRDVGYNASLLHPITPAIEGVVEVYGARATAPDEAEQGIAHLAPGVRIQPFPASAVRLALGVSTPLVATAGAATHLTLGVLYHW